jgi:hypothetical protein
MTSTANFLLIACILGFTISRIRLALARDQSVVGKVVLVRTRRVRRMMVSA